jgi:glycosyltransferase involved in cell wall biosynthesis
VINKMKKINVLGNIWGTSGYAMHTRQLVNALANTNDVALEGQKIEGWENQVNDKELEVLKKEYHPGENFLAISMPQQWNIQLNEPHKKFLGYCVWEGDKVPDFWINIFKDERVNYILVPSQHTKQAIENTIHTDLEDEIAYIMNKIIVVPHGVDHSIFYPVKKESGVFTFISNGGWAQGLNDRKGIQYALKAFNEEFSNEEPVEFLLKINTAYITPGWNLNDEMAKLQIRDKGGKIKIILQDLPFDKLKEFYWQGNVFVCTTMGEAFGLPMLEAMACGVPVITTNFGGQTDFVNNENGWLINSIPKENTWDILYEGIHWQEPLIDDIRKAMREAYNNPGLVKEKGLKAIETSSEYSWDKSAKLISELLD